MDKITNPHDKFVRETLSNKDIARDFLGNYLPEDVLEAIDLDSIEISKDSFIEKNLREYYSDLLYKVLLHNEQGYIYLLFEHKSREDKFVAVQLLGYIHNIWSLHLKQNKEKSLPIIIPMVLYHGRHKWSSGIRLTDLIAGPDEKFMKYIPNFEFVLYDLTRYSDDEIKGNLLARIFILLLKHAVNQDISDTLPRLLSLLYELEKQETGLKFLETFLVYLFSTADNISVDKFMDILEETNVHKEGGIIMTLAEQFINKGFKKGKIEGMLEGERKGMLEGKREGMLEGERKGMIEGERKGLLDGIELSISLKFGEIESAFISRIRDIKDVDRLRDIFKKVQLAASMDEIKEMLM